MNITVAIPTIPTRHAVLQRAINSVLEQTYPAAGISIAVDTLRQGAAANRTRALAGVTTEWVAFLDDDDEFKPQHLERLAAHAQETGADYVYSYFDVVGGSDPIQHFGKPWDDNDPRETTVTVLVRTELAKSVGGFLPRHAVGGGEDFQFTLGCLQAGAKISHLPERTWFWHHWGYGQPGQPGNTSGLPNRW